MRPLVKRLLPPAIAMALLEGTALLAPAEDVRAQVSPTPRQALSMAPPDVQYAARAADSILTTPNGGATLEAFHGDTVTGVYLQGSIGGRAESVGYGIDPHGRRYLWFSVGRGDSLDYVAMLFDVDRDLTPEFLLFRTIDRARRIETATEYLAPSVAGEDFAITIQPACAPPRCDPATWRVEPRERIRVPEFWFEGWRPLFGVAALRGETWLGESVASLQAAAPRAVPGAAPREDPDAPDAGP